MNYKLNAESETESLAWQSHVQSVKKHCLPSELERLATHSAKDNFAYCMCNPGYFCKLDCVHSNPQDVKVTENVSE